MLYDWSQCRKAINIIDMYVESSCTDIESIHTATWYDEELIFPNPVCDHSDPAEPPVFNVHRSLYTRLVCSGQGGKDLGEMLRLVL